MNQSVTDCESIDCHGLQIPYHPDVITERMANVIAKGRYEAGEVRMMQSLAKPGDKVLELGAGVGLISTVAAQIVGPENVVAIEANPGLIPIIRETHRRNGMQGVELIHGVGVTRPANGKVPFYLAEHFWASSLTPSAEGEAMASVDVPEIDINAVIAQHRPDIITMDIEGGEMALMDGLDVSTARVVIMELHPKQYGHKGTADIFAAMRDKGFAYNAKQSRGGSVVVFSRFRKHRPEALRVTAVSCLKNEAPFVLEWIAYHRSIGVTDFLLFTNDCTDGTDAILDRLDEMGIVRHLPNITPTIGSQRHQPYALAYASGHRQVRDADWIISMDVDEFLNIHVGDGSLTALFNSMPEANIISLTHLDFGCDGHDTYEPGLLTEQMQSADCKRPGEPDRRGVKTLIHRSVDGYKFANHRPRLGKTDGVVWMNGAGRAVRPRFMASKENGFDCRRTYRRAQINHYPVRSMESYLVKSARGNVVAIDQFVGLDYWQKRNRNIEPDTTIQRRLGRMKAELDTLLSDPKLQALQEAAVASHKAQIAQLLEREDMQNLLEAIRADHLSQGSDVPAVAAE